MNRTMLIGRLVKDMELKYTPGNGTAVATGTLAVERRVQAKDGKKEADFIPIVIWGKMAENTVNYCGTKGCLLGISGRIQTRSYDAKDGSKRYVTEIVADEVSFLDKPKNNAAASNGEEPSTDYSQVPVSDGDIPF